MSGTPKFSIIMPHYQFDGESGVTNEAFQRTVTSLENQTFRDFEVIIIHDGPPNDAEQLKLSPYEVMCTKERYNDWGHTLRDAGIKRATGEYILHLNADNVLYPNALEAINLESENTVLSDCIPQVKKELEHKRGPGSWEEFKKHLPYVDEPSVLKNIIIFPIYMIGVKCFGYAISDMRWLDNAKGIKHLMTGYPCIPEWIDCMQAVIKRSLWLEIGGWHNKEKASDGLLIQECYRKNKSCASYVTEILGEHR